MDFNFLMTVPFKLGEIEYTAEVEVCRNRNRYNIRGYFLHGEDVTDNFMLHEELGQRASEIIDEWIKTVGYVI